MSKLRLTELGRLAYRFGSMTPASFWRSLFKDVMRAADEDADWELLLHERIEGMKELLATAQRCGLGWYER